jgi:DNA-binding XRE family transcriptional regulator
MTRDTRQTVPYLRDWRVHRLLSVSELARTAKVSRVTIINLENDKSAANLTTVGKLASALQVTRRQLVDAPPSSDSTERASQNSAS